VADRKVVYNEYNINIIDFGDIENIDAAVFCVAYDSFKKMDLLSIKPKFRNKYLYIFNVKGIFNKRVWKKLALSTGGCKLCKLSCYGLLIITIIKYLEIVIMWDVARGLA